MIFYQSRGLQAFSCDECKNKILFGYKFRRADKLNFCNQCVEKIKRLYSFKIKIVTYVGKRTYRKNQGNL